MLFLRRTSKLRALHSQLAIATTRIQQNSTSTEVARSSDDHIEIPNRIPRTPTAILEALASTVGRDPTAPHYKYHDDPYLIPSSNIGKRTFAMAQESGRKAADWVKEQHRDLFLHKVAQPPIEAFAPKMVFTDETEVDESSLNSLIQHNDVADATFVYNALKTKGIEIASETKQSFLELISFYNNEEPLPDEYIEERWFKQSSTGRERQRKTWKDGDLAEALFAEIEPKTPQSYAAIIRGMCKYYQVERAFALFQQATEQQIEIDTKTFNSLLSVSSFFKDSGDLRWETCQDLLRQMNERQLLPDVGTLNAILETISTIGNHRVSRVATLKTLSEFKQLGVEPCLATYYYVLMIFCRERGPVSHVIVDILREIESREFKIAHPKDTYFFVTAMDVCRNHLHDKSLAKKVDALLHCGNNYDLLGDTYKESIYYRHYFALLAQTEPLETFMETYDLLVPNVYIPEPGIMEEILKAVEMNGELELVPRMWSDMVIFDLTNRESLLNRILNIMTENKPNAEMQSHTGLAEKFATIAFDIYTRIEGQNENRTQKLTFSGQMIGQILQLILRSGDFAKAIEVFTNIDKNQHKIPGTPTQDVMAEFINACIVEKAPGQAITCLQYCVDNAMNVKAFARRISKDFNLNEGQLAKVKSLVGEEFLK